MIDKVRKRKDRVGQILIHFLVAMLMAVLANYGIEVFYRKVSPKLKSLVHIWWFTLVGTIVVSLVGLGLFFFRKYRQREYGLIEIGFALAVGWSGMVKVQSTNDIAAWTTVVAAAYLVVRGLSNYDEGRQKNA